MTGLDTILSPDLAGAAGLGTAVALTFLRVGAAAALFPGVGEATVPARIRLALALVLTLAILPSTMPRLAGLSLGQSFAGEVVAGLFLGLALRFFLFALMTAGAVIANATPLSQLFAQDSEPQPALSHFLVIAGIAVALQADLLPQLVRYLVLSYDALPPGGLPDPGPLAEWLAQHADAAFSLGFRLAMPFVISATLYNLALGVINRAMPQLMVTFIGAPALSLGGLVLLALTAPVLLSVWLASITAFLGSGVAGP